MCDLCFVCIKRNTNKMKCSKAIKVVTTYQLAPSAYLSYLDIAGKCYLQVTFAQPVPSRAPSAAKLKRQLTRAK